MELAPGTLFQDRFRITRLLGRGGFSCVYEAADELMTRSVAIKFLNKPTSLMDEDARRFLREAKILSSIQSPYLVRIYSIQESAGYFYMVMELLNGQTLRQVLSEGVQLSEEKALQIAEGVAEALSVLESHSVVHRDLKPDNIMLVRDGQNANVKVIDLGLAGLLRDLGNEQAITAEGAVVGTVYYMAPESCLGSKADLRADFYSLGCILYEGLTGNTPFEGIDAVEVMHRQVQVMPAAPGIPLSPEMLNFLNVLLQKEPDKRFNNTGELLFAIQSIFDSNGLPATVSTTEAVNRESFSQSKYLLRKNILAIAVVTTMMIGLALSLNHSFISWTTRKSTGEVASISVLCHQLLQLDLATGNEPEVVSSPSNRKAIQPLDDERTASALHSDIKKLELLLSKKSAKGKQRFTPDELSLLLRLLKRLEDFNRNDERRRIIIAMLRADYNQNMQSSSILSNSEELRAHLYELNDQHPFDEPDFGKMLVWASTNAPAAALEDLAPVLMDVYRRAKVKGDVALAESSALLSIRALKELKQEKVIPDLYLGLGDLILVTSTEKAIGYWNAAMKLLRGQNKSALCVYWSIQYASKLADAGKPEDARGMLSSTVQDLPSCPKDTIRSWIQAAKSLNGQTPLKDLSDDIKQAQSLLDRKV